MFVEKNTALTTLTNIGPYVVDPFHAWVDQWSTGPLARRYATINYGSAPVWVGDQVANTDCIFK